MVKAIRRSEAKFDRWHSREATTWPFQVFKKYTKEYERMFWAQITSKKYVFSKLGSSGADWKDDVELHLNCDGVDRDNLYKDLRDWSSAYNQLEKWTVLNGVMAVSANLETYMASVIKLALESDPGLLFASSRKVDGMHGVKFGRKIGFDSDKEVVSCTKGDWSARVKAYERVFGKTPEVLQKNIGLLDEMRRVRNNIGHAFGRDIESSREHSVKNILPMESVSIERSIKYKKTVWMVAKAIDKHLLMTHIGEYQLLRFYHNTMPRLDGDIHKKAHLIKFRKEIGKTGAVLRGLEECSGLLDYYRAL
ncbi:MULTISPECIES: hypothetical protein [Pseudomonas syringae group]|uniref:RiboL-PSP-HEPN domain-containing protein n=1 Tax=Pseudomonas savastanoi TaxID=29438 RepID=A0AAW3M688_PSESS|nr:MULTISPECIES: hypothetical protein [Pseudomonas syringae group]KTC61732.1 hypothetical protein AO287_04690 [Pseudomonas savastanoi]MDU8457850.1 hypothetical protein [Pseudomonas syringae group sp. J254-4]